MDRPASAYFHMNTSNTLEKIKNSNAYEDSRG